MDRQRVGHPGRLAQMSPAEKRVLLGELLRERAAHTAGYPLSYTQRSMWFLHKFAQGSVPYNVMFAWRIRSALDPAAMGRAFQHLIDRHPILRTTYPERNGKPYQRVHPHLEAPFRITDAAAWDDERLELALAHEGHRPFDLERGPVIRMSLFSRSADEHVLLLSMHHIATDFWSLVVLLNELAAAYRAELAGETPSLTVLQARYTDFVRWQEALLVSPAGERQWLYWQKRLAGGVPPLNLPTARPRPPAPTYRGEGYGFALPEGLTAKVQQLAKAEGITLYTLLLAAFQVLLHRYTGQEDFGVGSPAAGRSKAEFERVQGFFANTVVLRADCSGNPAFRSFLRRVRDTVLDALAHQDYPFPLLVSRLPVDRASGHSPLCQVVFVLQRPPRSTVGSVHGSASPFAGPPGSGTGMRLDLGGISLEPVVLRQELTRFDLDLNMLELGGLLAGWIQYSTDLFDRPTIVRLAGHFQALLEGIVADPDTPIGVLPLLGDPERQELLLHSQGTRVAIPEAVCCHEVFEAQAARVPDAIAVSLGDECVAYAELNRRANQLAHHLRSHGVAPGALVGIYLERSAEIVVGLLGILKAGAAYLPLDPAYPPERVAFMIEDAKVPVLVTQAHLAGALPDHHARLVCLDTDAELIRRESERNPASGVTADDLAYVIYTSGSTGQPKGVQVTHRNVVRLFRVTERVFGFDGSDVWTLFHSCAFDFSVWELWGALFYGGRLVVVPFLTSRSPKDFHELLCRERVTVLNQTPSAFRQLMRAEETAGCGELALRFVILGGEALEPESLRSWFARHGDQRPQMVNMYGITETTVHVTYRPITLADLNRGVRSVIGRPLDDLEVYVVDQHRQLCPVGIPGEMYVGGAGVARGYLGRPELTAERFVANPWNGDSCARLYRSGDQARRLPDGDLEYLGRVDHQVKIRGFRIELGEIEAVLAQHPAVSEAVVTLRQRQRDDQRLDAYVLLRPGAAAPIVEFRRLVQTALPNYMVPSSFTVIESLPRTPSGKVDREAVARLAPAHHDTRAATALPQTERQRQIAEIWGEVLGVDGVGIDDNFFEIGGHSLNTVDVQARLRRTLEVELSLVDLFRFPTIRALAEHLEGGHVETGHREDSQGRAKRQREAFRRRQQAARAR
jgi:amino acid adenylation domain-containing protein